MKDYNKVLLNPSDYELSETEKNYINLFIRNDKDTQERIRNEQKNFRKICIEKYKKCIISGVFSGECQACHIIPYSIGLNNVNNSLLLNYSLHKLFDDGYWTIDSDTGIIIISEEIKDEETSIHAYKNINLKNILNEELSNNLKYHYEHIFKN
jgi:putative restriction endonuclease